MKTYIGDSVYVESDGYYLILTTENGFGCSNKIMIEPQVWKNLTDYVAFLTRGNTAKEKSERN